AEIAEFLKNHPAYFHTDGAQSFGKDIETLRTNRLDLISISSHKIFGPKGIGALVVRRRGYKRVPLTPLIFGGGQERGIRPGTLPVAQVAALGKAAEMSIKEHKTRVAKCQQIKAAALKSFEALEIRINGSPEHTHDHVLNFAVPGIDSEAMIVALKDLVAISNGSACTSASYTPSHVMLAMGQSEDEANEALRFSWCHLTDDIDWDEIARRIKSLR
ncbi:MAG: aminotransferase class V-fold PLP-dependent enzyme, partial [Akkermansiaceae bacterium]